MRKRYFFFRNEQGKKSDKDYHAPKELLALISRSARPVDGGVGWTDFSLQRWEAALRLSVMMIDGNDNEVVTEDAWKIFRLAMVDVIRRSPGKIITSSQVLELADQRASEYFRLPLRPYLLVTSLGIDKLPQRSMTVGKSVISAINRGRQAFPVPEALRQVKGTAFARHLESTRFLWIKVATKARTTFGAVESSINAVNLVRGLWTLFSSFRSFRFRIGGGSIGPIAVIHHGPIHTLHNPDGSNADENIYWYRPEYSADHEISRDLGRYERHRRWAMSRLRKMPHRGEVEDVILRYVTALDSPNPNVAFLQMWSILEKLTNTVGTGSYEETIRRVLWVFSDRERMMARETLHALRLSRNLYVHSAQGAHDSDQVAYLVKFFVDPFLLRLLQNPMKSRSLVEFGDFHSLPRDAAALERQIKDRRHALSFIRRANEEDVDSD